MTCALQGQSVPADRAQVCGCIAPNPWWFLGNEGTQAFSLRPGFPQQTSWRVGNNSKVTDFGGSIFSGNETLEGRE